MKPTTERDEPAKPERTTKVRLRMEPFDLPLLCAALFAALFWCVAWGPEWLLLSLPGPAFAYGVSALLTTMVVSLIWAAAGRVRGSIIRRILHWIVAIPTVLADLLFVLLTVATVTAPENSEEMGLVIVPLFGIVICGLAVLLLIAFFPSRAAAPPAP